MTPLAPAESNGAWIQPAQTFPAEPRWGHSGGLQIGLDPLAGPRGLIRIYAPYLGDKPEHMINFIAVEPIPAGSDERGYSELEYSHFDNLPGKRFWTSNAPADNEPRQSPEPARGVIYTIDGVEFLRLWLHIEPFDNGARVMLRLTFRADRPFEISLATHVSSDSVPLDYCIVSATMGNYARLRRVKLASRTISPADIWGAFEGEGFTDHGRFPAASLVQKPGGGVTASATSDEFAPVGAEYSADTAEHWKYHGERAVQTWSVDDADPRLELLVNARRDYWASRSPIPGGLSFENFELVEPFSEGREFTFEVRAE
jgi:hypothetical protein